MLDNSLFWECYDPREPTRVSTIFGTIHLMTARTAHIVKRVQKEIDAYDHVFTEAPLTFLENGLLNAHIFVDPGLWRQFWSQKKKDKIRRMILRSLDVDIDQQLSLRPMFILTALFGKMLEEIQGGSMDQLIWDDAMAKNKTLGGLESIEEQMETMKRLSIEQEYRQIWQMAKNITAARRQFFSLIDLYAGERIVDLLKKTKGSLGPNKQVLLYERNIILADRILKQHAEQPALFTFGAAHLPGRKGVLNLLKQKGVKVRSKKNSHEESQN